MTTIRAAGAPLVARQPVYDRSLRVVGYELLVQRRDGSSVDAEEGPARSLSEVGLSLVMGQVAYVPVTRGFVLEGFATTLPADRVVLKVPAGFDYDAPAIDKLRELVARGYPLMLDRFSFGGPAQPLLPVASIVGFDAGSGAAALALDLERVRRFGPSLMGQDVLDYDTLERCLERGFDLLQGSFFCRPRLVTGRSVEVGQLGSVRLAAALHQPDVDFDAIEEVISTDVGLSFNLLRFLNSAFFSLPRRVDSIRDALVLLGVRNIRKWASLMALAGAGDKPHELVVTGLVRARMCELLARTYGHHDPEGFFITGLFSVVDALTDTSMVELLASLPLSQEVSSALLSHAGAKGRILRAVIAYERGSFAELADLPPAQTPLGELYSESVLWATEASGAIRCAELAA